MTWRLMPFCWRRTRLRPGLWWKRWTWRRRPRLRRQGRRRPRRLQQGRRISWPGGTNKLYKINSLWNTWKWDNLVVRRSIIIGQFFIQIMWPLSLSLVVPRQWKFLQLQALLFGPVQCLKTSYRLWGLFVHLTSKTINLQNPEPLFLLANFMRPVKF